MRAQILSSSERLNYEQASLHASFKATMSIKYKQLQMIYRPGHTVSL